MSAGNIFKKGPVRALLSGFNIAVRIVAPKDA
jgi:hypothetical protein